MCEIKPWMARELISKMDERRRRKNVQNEEGRKGCSRPRNGEVKNEYLERMCDEIIEFQAKGCYDIVYMQTKEAGYWI